MSDKCSIIWGTSHERRPPADPPRERKEQAVIPTMQTRFGRGHGNCLLACVASLLHRQLESIPDFSMSGSWFEDLYEWCLNESIGLICVHPKDLDHTIVLNTHCIMIFTVKGIDSENHAVIGKCSREERPFVELEDGMKWKWVCEPTFDPNPNGVAVENLEHLIFLLPSQTEDAEKVRP